MTTPIITLDNARRWIRARSQDTQDDDLLSELINVATEMIEDEIGPCAPRQYVEAYNGGGKGIYLLHQPVISVESVTEYAGTARYALNDEPMGAEVDSWGYTLDPVSGVVQRRMMGGQAALFMPGEGNIIVTYTAGREVVPSAVTFACAMLTRHLYEMSLPAGKNRNEEEAPMAAYAMPAGVMEMLKPYLQAPGIA